MSRKLSKKKNPSVGIFKLLAPYKHITWHLHFNAYAFVVGFLPQTHLTLLSHFLMQ